jgi:transcriptional regulator with XRE-family HTH domain
MSKTILDIKNKIRDAGISQKDIAYAMGISEVHLNGTLNETRIMTDSILQRIEFAYNELRYKKNNH